MISLNQVIIQHRTAKTVFLMEAIFSTEWHPLANAKVGDKLSGCLFGADAPEVHIIERELQFTRFENHVLGAILILWVQ